MAATPATAAIAAATLADSPAIMQCGSMRNELNATWLARMQAGGRSGAVIQALRLPCR